MDNIILEELQNMKYLFGYKPGKVISEQVTPAAPAAPATATPATVDGLIKQIQNILNTKYDSKLVVDGKWGNLTQTALDQAIAKVKAGTQPPAPGTQQLATVSQPPVSKSQTVAAVTPPTNITAPTAQNLPQTTTQPTAAPVTPELSQQSQEALSGKLTPQQIRQQSRFDQRLSRQARRNERRAGQS